MSPPTTSATPSHSTSQRVFGGVADASCTTSFGSKDAGATSPTTPPASQCHITSDLPCSADTDHSPLPHATYMPGDIPAIQRALLRFLPAELADIIIDMAEIHPWVAASRNAYTPALSALQANDGNAQWGYLVSPEVPSLKGRDGESLPTEVKKVKFFIKAYDSKWGQASSSDASAAPSTPPQTFHTWFEASVLKPNDQLPTSDPQISTDEIAPCEPQVFDPTTQPSEWFKSLSGPNPKMLHNILSPVSADPANAPTANMFDSKERWHVTDNVANNEWQEIVWTPGATVDKLGKGFLESLEVGERIVLIARAMSPAWINTVFNVRTEVYYGLRSSRL